jgi:hypothetical protein
MKIKSQLLAALLILMLSGCKDKYDVASYYPPSQQDSVLTDIVTYVYVRPQGATPETRFDQKFRPYYVQESKKFQFKEYFVNENGKHFFFLIRPARSPLGNLRGVAGTFERSHDGKIIHFREVFNTPVLSKELLITRGNELFKYLIHKGNVDDYVKNPDYIEWPNSNSFYDTVRYEWLIKPGA